MPLPTKNPTTVPGAGKLTAATDFGVTCARTEEATSTAAAARADTAVPRDPATLDRGDTRPADTDEARAEPAFTPFDTDGPADTDDPDDPEPDPSSANATAGTATITAPTPRANAKPPTRPTTGRSNTPVTTERDTLRRTDDDDTIGKPFNDMSDQERMNTVATQLGQCASVAQ